MASKVDRSRWVASGSRQLPNAGLKNAPLSKARGRAESLQSGSPPLRWVQAICDVSFVICDAGSLQASTPICHLSFVMPRA
jgi:hypothetical protein